MMRTLVTIVFAYTVAASCGCGATASQVRSTSCTVYEKAVQACRALPEECPWRERAE